MSALPIFPVRLQTSIFGRSELNFRVRNGNGWTLALISTDFVDADFVSFAAALAPRLIHSIASPLPRRPALAGLCSEFMLFGIFLPINNYSILLSQRHRRSDLGDPYRIRTDVKGVRGLCLNHLTNGPFGTPSVGATAKAACGRFCSSESLTEKPSHRRRLIGMRGTMYVYQNVERTSGRAVHWYTFRDSNPGHPD